MERAKGGEWLRRRGTPYTRSISLVYGIPQLSMYTEKRRMYTLIAATHLYTYIVITINTNIYVEGISN